MKSLNITRTELGLHYSIVTRGFCVIKSFATLIVKLLFILSLSITISPQHDSKAELLLDPDIRQQAKDALEHIRDWSLRFGRDIHYGGAEVSCIRTIRDQYEPAKSDSSLTGNNKASIVSIDWPQTHAEIVKTISNTMSWHQDAVEAIAEASESLAGSHKFEKNLTFDYIDVHHLHSLDEQEDQYEISNEPNSNQDTDSILNNTLEAGSGEVKPEIDLSSPDESSQDPSVETKPKDAIDSELEPDKSIEPLPKPSQLVQATETSQTSIEWQPPNKYLDLKRHPNFGDVLINTDESAVHVPVHIYPGNEHMMNDIAWSEKLTQTFRTNFMKNPKLTNQFFASQSGFMRLFPAQKWQVAREDPDLYDARMRPWYLAGSSSRKDVVILVDSSGSMTGSRRDIARGVVLEILDTLTDNDYFLVLKFSDIVQQVGVPSCPTMRKKRRFTDLPLKNTILNLNIGSDRDDQTRATNETDTESFYLLPANGRNIRHVKTNFTISTSGIANFSHALITAFEVLKNYQDDENLGSQCNQAIMLITDGSPSDFEEIFNRYNYPNAPVRVFTYLIGREAGDVTHTKMMACHNRGYYTHVINLAEVRETVQQYIPVMARPLVLNGTHPITWTPAYGELTYQILTDWIWESRRREKARSAWAANQSGSSANNGSLVPDIRFQSSEFPPYDNDQMNLESGVSNEVLESFDLFGYQTNSECFWQTRRNDLLTTVVQPVYDTNNVSTVTEKFLLKNVWTTKDTVMRTAKLLGVAAADMKISDIVALAPSHKLGPNGYAIMLTNNGFAMHHPDLRSILEPTSSDPNEKNARILKPFFSSIDFSRVEHISDPLADGVFLQLRKEAVSGLTGWRELATKRAIDCQRRVQLRKQNFYYKPLDIFPFSFIVAIPQPYGSHKIKAQVEVKSSSLPQKPSIYFTTSDYELLTVHPEYQYCDGPSNDTLTSVLSMLYQIESGQPDDVQWKPLESSKPPLYIPGKIVCDKELVQSLVFDAAATFGFSENCAPSASSDE